MTATLHHLSSYTLADEHVCIARYRDTDGRVTRCWCGATVRPERERVELPCDVEPEGSAA